jgi:hypothetical protein
MDRRLADSQIAEILHLPYFNSPVHMPSFMKDTEYHRSGRKGAADE